MADEEKTIGIIDRSLKTEMETSYMEYAMSVIVSRALPDARDGLKPVQRRILYATMEEAPYSGTHKKSAAIVGTVMKSYHPHGDAAIYDTMVRMAQDFTLRYPLIDGQGNFGSIDGDGAAAPRYTEARMAKIATEIIADIKKDTVDMIPNYDGSTLEPAVMPSRIPTMLLNGATGIAVGMTTNIPPHNLTEVSQALIHLLANPQATIEDLMVYVKGPDFPTGGIINGLSGIKQVYTTGHGRIIVRARYTIETAANGRERIIVTEMPYLVNKANLVAKIAELANDRKIEGIADLRDESGRQGMRVVIEIKREARPHVVLNNLYKHTSLQHTFGAIMLALVDGRPQVLSLKQILEGYIAHRKEVIVRRTKFELAEAQARAHILEGLLICLKNLDKVVATIRGAADAPTASTELQEKFGLTERQAEAVLEMALRRLTGLEREKLEKEYSDLLELITKLEGILASDEKVRDIIREDLEDILKKYGDERRTELSFDEAKDISDEDLIPREEVVVTLTHRGYIKRQPARDFRGQKRGGQGVKVARPTEGMTEGQVEEDHAEHIITTSTHMPIDFFTERGKVFRVRGLDIPERERGAKGSPINNIIDTESEERVTAVASRPEDSADGFLVMVTRLGRIQRVRAKEFEQVRRNGLIAMTILPGDSLGWAFYTRGEDDVIIVTEAGKAIRFMETNVRASGRGSQGVGAIKMAEKDRVAGAAVVIPDGQILVVTENGFGKRTMLEEYPTKNRGGQGIFTYKVTSKVGNVAAIRILSDETEEILLITASGKVMRTEASSINKMGRQTQGVTVIKVNGEDRLVALAPVGGED